MPVLSAADPNGGMVEAAGIEPSLPVNTNLMMVHDFGRYRIWNTMPNRLLSNTIFFERAVPFWSMSRSFSSNPQMS